MLTKRIEPFFDNNRLRYYPNNCIQKHFGYYSSTLKPISDISLSLKRYKSRDKWKPQMCKKD